MYEVMHVQVGKWSHRFTCMRQCMYRLGSGLIGLHV